MAGCRAEPGFLYGFHRVFSSGFNVVLRGFKCCVLMFFIGFIGFNGI